MLHKIAIEEHIAVTETFGETEMNQKLILDQMDEYIKEMDTHGVDMMFLSIKNPGTQGIFDKGRSAELAKKANDALAEAIAKRPKRFLGYATLPLQDPDAASAELHRAVKDLGFIGALANGFSQIGTKENCTYYDIPMYRPFWAEVEKLDVPFYLHPRNPLPANSGAYEGHMPWFTRAAWVFGVETATHTLRLMCSGLFDDYPKLKLILGHLGEGLPFLIWRAEHTFTREKRRERDGMPAKRPMPEYMARNIWYTTSGQLHLPSLLQTMLEFGSDRIMFAADCPYETLEEASIWFDSCLISEGDRQKIGRDNIVNLFKLKDI